MDGFGLRDWWRSHATWRTAYLLFLGQVVSFVMALMSFTSSLIADLGVDTPLTQTLFGYFVLALVYGNLLLYRRQRLKVSWYWYLILGFVDVQGNYLVNKAYQFSSITSVTLLDCWTVAWVIVLTWLFLGTRYSLWQLFGVALCVLGLGLVLLSDAGVGGGGGSKPLLGDILVISGTIFYALSNVGEEFCVKKKDRVEVICMIGVYGFLVSVVEISVLELKSLESVEWSIDIILSFFGYTVATFMFYSLVPFVLKLSGATMFNLSILTSDMWAVVIRIFFYKQQVDWLYYLAFAIVVVGLILYSTTYMGTIVGISDLDPLRWPGSKCRNLQVEWDEPGCCDKQNMVSPWEVETPESLFIFPSLTSGLKRPFHSGFLGTETEWGNMVKRPLVRVPDNGNGDLPYPIPNIYSEELIKMLLKPQHMNHPGNFYPTVQQESATKVDPLRDMKIMQQGTTNQKFHLICSEGTPPIQPQSGLDQPDAMNLNSSSKAMPPGKFNSLAECENRTLAGINTERPIIEPEISTDELSQLTSTGECNKEKLVACPVTQNLVNQPTFINQNQEPLQSQTSSWPMQPQLESLIYHPQQLDVPQSDCSNPNGFLPSLDPDEWKFYPSCQPLGGMFRSPGPLSMFGLQDSSALFPEAVNPALPPMGQEMWDHQLNNLRILSQADQLTSFSHQDSRNLSCISNSSGLRDLSDESYNQSGNIDNNGGSTAVDPSVSSTILDDLCTVKNAGFQTPSDCLVGNFSSSQDVQSQITSASLGDSQAFSRQELPDSSGGTSSSNVDFDEGSLLQNSSWPQVVPLVRTNTKVQKKGSVGRSIDVTGFRNYDELCAAIECMFGLEGLLNDPRGSGWKLVYVDYENDVLLVGDDPWEQFVRCVRCIKILSPSEVQKVSEEGM